MSIQQLVDKALLAEQNKEREHSGKFSPSQLGRCYRAQIFKRKGEEQTNPPDSRALRVFRVGHLFHEFIQDFIPAEQVEVEIEDDDFRGRADIVEKNCVTDIKSVHSRSFWYMEKQDYDVCEQKYTNWLQVAWYAWKLGKEYIRILFVSKDDLCIAEYREKLEDWKDSLMAELYTLEAWWVSGKLPPAEPRAYGGKECKYCGYSELCKQIEEDK